VSKQTAIVDTSTTEDIRRQLAALEYANAGLTVDGVDAVLTREGPLLMGDARFTVAQSEARYRHLIKRMAALVIELTPSGEIIYLNEAITHITGFSAEELIGSSWLDILLPIHDSVSLSLLRQSFLESGELTDFRTSIRSCDGSRKFFSWNSVNVHDANGLIERIIYFGINVTNQVLAEQELAIAAIAFESQEGMIVTDANRMILRVNSAFTTITGYTAEEAIGKNPRMLKSGHQSADFYTAMWTDINNNGAWSGEIWNQRKHGECYPERLTITAVKGANGMVTNYVGTLADITMSMSAAEKIKHLAFYDPLTELPNRLLLRDRLKPALASSKRSGRLGALLFIDMDDFKTLNDSLGHDMGDLLLQQVARRLELCVREGDTVARLGGDEFVVMLEDLSGQALEAATQTEIIGNKILTVLNRPYQLAMHYYHCTPSIGAILFNDHEQSVDELLKQADIAMYQAKASGRNTLRFFDPQMQIIIDTRVAMEADLRLALAENQFELYYQPQVYHNRQIISAEVLIRWRHPQRGFISPADFIPLAEGTGLILPIGQWVLETACAQLKSWESNSSTQHLLLAVNVSARQFHQTDFVEQVNQVLRRTAINPNRLKLELTESLVLDNIDETIIKMNALREIGISFSMDDFGTGYSSLSSLKQLPLDQLKIDKSFVCDLTIDRDDAVIVQTIIAMARNLGMGVIAEGVETEAQRAFLEQHDCPLFQGYLFSKPVPIGQFEQLLKL
jgi:diguanylate cyclase (GGDEF)-like protein/PAS domain S-box-containing protein